VEVKNEDETKLRTHSVQAECLMQ